MHMYMYMYSDMAKKPVCPASGVMTALASLYNIIIVCLPKYTLTCLFSAYSFPLKQISSSTVPCLFFLGLSYKRCITVDAYVNFPPLLYLFG